MVQFYYNPHRYLADILKAGLTALLAISNVLCRISQVPTVVIFYYGRNTPTRKWLPAYLPPLSPFKAKFLGLRLYTDVCLVHYALNGVAFLPIPLLPLYKENENHL